MQPEPTRIADDISIDETPPVENDELAHEVADDGEPTTADEAQANGQRRVRILQRELRRLRVDNLRLRADLEEVRAQACDWLPATPSESARREIEAAADRVADRIEEVSPDTAQSIRDEVGGNLRRRLESVALVAEKELADARRRASTIRRRAQAAATTTTETAEANAAFHTELSRLAAEEAANAIHREAETTRENAFTEALVLKERAEQAAMTEREQAIRAAERIIGEAHNRAHGIIREARIRAESLGQAGPDADAGIDGDSAAPDLPTLQLPIVSADATEEIEATADAVDVTDMAIAVESAELIDDAEIGATDDNDADEDAADDDEAQAGDVVLATSDDDVVDTATNKSFESLWHAEAGYDEEDMRRFFDDAEELPATAADALFS